MAPDFLTDLFLWVIILSCAFAIAFSKSLINCLIYLSIFSLVTAGLFLSMEAPDVAITEAAIGASISTLFILATIRIVGRKTSGKVKNLYPALVVLLILFASLTVVIQDLPNYGDPESAANKGVAEYYVKNTESDIGIPAIVAAVLASYRAYDTLGELYVVLAAGIAVLLILPAVKKGKKV